MSADKFVGIIDEGFEPTNNLETIEKCIHIAATKHVNDLFICDFVLSKKEIDALVTLANTFFIRINFLAKSKFYPFLKSTYLRLADSTVFTRFINPLDDWSNRLSKRVFDIFFCLFVLIFIMSWLTPLLGILIKITSPGPVFFKQKRSGINGVHFWCYKFRSMALNRDADTAHAVLGDSRVTSVGRWIRKTSIDELPQFWNVLWGDMSIVGPRPHMLHHTTQFQKLNDDFSIRHFVKPGITGLAQVSGLRGDISQSRMLEKRISADIKYINEWHIITDIKICFLTFYFMLVGDDKAF